MTDWSETAGTPVRATFLKKKEVGISPGSAATPTMHDSMRESYAPTDQADGATRRTAARAWFSAMRSSPSCVGRAVYAQACGVARCLVTRRLGLLTAK